MQVNLSLAPPGTLRLSAVLPLAAQTLLPVIQSILLILAMPSTVIQYHGRIPRVPRNETGGRSAPIKFKHSHFEARDHSRTAQHFHGRNDRSEERAGPYCDVP